MRVYELSKELGVVSKGLIEVAKSIGISLKSHVSSVKDDEAIKIRDILSKSKQTVKSSVVEKSSLEVVTDKKKVKVFKSESGQEVVERRKGPKVILRRKRKVEEDTQPDSVEEAREVVNDTAIEARDGVSIAETREEKLPDLIIEEKSEESEVREDVSGEGVTNELEKEADEDNESVITQDDAVEENKAEEKEYKAPGKTAVEELAKDTKKVRKKGKVVKPRKEEVIDEDALEELRKAFRTKLPVRKKEYLVENRRPKAKFHDSGRYSRISDRNTPARVEVASGQESSASGQVIPLIPKPAKRTIKISETINVGEIAKKMGVKVGAVLRKLLSLGVTSSINQSIDHETASILAQEFDYEVVVDIYEEDQHLVEVDLDEQSNLISRSPVVTVMGHVDHGKTTLLDTIRKTKVAEGEAGGITQHIGAYSVTVQDKKVTFIDTPGHEAFSAMRARGAQITDVVILVVAADDGVMPQTIEAVNHAKAAEVPILVAVNKIDKPEAEPERVKRELSEIGLVPEDWGGDTLFAEVSAKTGEGIEQLLDLILLQADVLELKANPNKRANGIVVESKLDKGRGPIATVIVKEGTLNIGDCLISGVDYGKVRALINDHGNNINLAGPSMPTEIMGFSTVPSAGVPFYVVNDEKTIKEIISHRESKKHSNMPVQKRKISLENLFENLEKGETKKLPLIIKADTQGSVGALKDSINKLSSDKCTVKIVHSAVGAINESDIVLASASDAIVLGFNVRPDPKSLMLSEKKSVSIELHSVIYDALDRIKSAMEGLLEPIKKESILGHAEVRDTFHVSKIGTIAGCYITDGKFTRNSHIRLVRDGIVVYDGELESLRRFKDDVKEVQSGYECGIGIQNFNDIKVGDVLENYIIVEEKQKL